MATTEQELPQPPPEPGFSIRFSDGREFGPAKMETVLTWAREGRVPKSAEIVNAEDDTAQSVMDVPAIAKILTVPPQHSSFQSGDAGRGDETVATIVPYRNPTALTGYYVSIFSLLPVFGILLGPTAIVLGVIGLRAYKADPKRKGVVHGWIAIALGLVGTLISAMCLSGIAFAWFDQI